MWEALRAAWTASGGAAEWARRLPELLDGCGLDAVDSETTVETFRGGTSMARAVQEIFEHLREPMLAAGLRENVLDGVLSVLDIPTRWFPGFAVVAAWGRRTAT